MGQFGWIMRTFFVSPLKTPLPGMRCLNTASRRLGSEVALSYGQTERELGHGKTNREGVRTTRSAILLLLMTFQRYSVCFLPTRK